MCNHIKSPWSASNIFFSETFFFFQCVVPCPCIGNGRRVLTGRHVVPFASVFFFLPQPKFQPTTIKVSLSLSCCRRYHFDATFVLLLVAPLHLFVFVCSFVWRWRRFFEGRLVVQRHSWPVGDFFLPLSEGERDENIKDIDCKLLHVSIQWGQSNRTWTKIWFILKTMFSIKRNLQVFLGADPYQVIVCCVNMQSSTVNSMQIYRYGI